MSKKTPEEQPKRKVAKQVITPKRRYFVPGRGIVTAATAERAARKGVKVTTKSEVGDGNR